MKEAEVEIIDKYENGVLCERKINGVSVVILNIGEKEFMESTIKMTPEDFTKQFGRWE